MDSVLQTIQKSLKGVIGFPQITFWLSIVAGDAGLLSSILIFILTDSKHQIPTVYQALTSKISYRTFLIFGLICIPCIATVAYRTHQFIQKTIKMAVKNQNKLVSQLYLGNQIACVLLPLSYTLLVFFKSNFFLHLFVLSFIAFHVTTDMLYAICMDTMIRIAWYSNLAIGSLYVLFYVLQFLRLITKSRGIQILANWSLQASYFVCFMKIIFTGILVLGARFIDTDIEMFKKEKQTIFDESYGLA